MTVLQAVADAQQPPTAAVLARACGYPRPTVYRILAALAEQGMLMESGGVAGRALQRPAAPGPSSTCAPRWRPSCRRCVTPPARPCTWRRRRRDGLYRQAGKSRSGAHGVARGRGRGPAFQRRGQGLPGRAGRGRARTVAGRTAAGSAHAVHAGQPAGLRAVETARGYAVDDEENEPGIVCYGVGCATRAGRPVGVSVSMLLFRRRDDPQSAYIDPLLRLRDAPPPNSPCCQWHPALL